MLEIKLVCRPITQGTKDGDKGSRLPAVWIRPSATEVLLQIGYCLGNNWNYYVHPIQNFNEDIWFNLKISQTNGFYEIKINDSSVQKATNPDPKMWTDVKVVIGNTYGNTLFVPALGYYRNFVIRNFDQFTVEKRILCPEWKVSFDLYLYNQPVRSKPAQLFSFVGSSRIPSISASNHDAENAVLHFRYEDMLHPPLDLQGGWKLAVINYSKSSNGCIL